MKVTEQEFLNIIDKNERRINHLCRVYTDGVAERKDLYQEIVIQVWHSLPGFKGNAQLSTWIYRIGLNTAISFFRKKNTRQEYHDEYKKEYQSTGNAIGETELSNKEQIDRLYEAISTLNASEKAIISMYLEEFSYAQISYTMDITENYVGVKLNRIKKKLASILGDENGI